jgi:hypothetical protein
MGRTKIFPQVEEGTEDCQEAIWVLSFQAAIEI